MKKAQFILSVLLLTVVIGCASETEKEEAVMAAAHQSWENARLADLDAMLAPMLPTVNGAYGMQGEMMWTTEAVAKSYAEGFVGVVSQDIEMEREEVTMLSPTSAVYAGYGIFRQYDSAGELLVESAQAISIVFVLKDNEWKIRHMHQSFPGSGDVK